MRLNLSSDYALRLLMYLASNPDRLCTIAEVAEHYAVSRTHLMKLTNNLANHGWISTVRGKNGGMQLAKAASNISIAAVIADCESDFQLVECMGEANLCRLDGSCRLKGVLHGAMQAFTQHLQQYTLADLISPAITTLLFHPPLLATTE